MQDLDHAILFASFHVRCIFWTESPMFHHILRPCSGSD